MRSAFARRGRHQRHLLAVKPGFANQQTRGYGHAHPSIFQNIDGQGGASRGQVAGHVQVVIHARQRCVRRRRFGIVLNRVGFRPQHAVFIDRNHDPSRDVGSLSRLIVDSGCGLGSGSPTDRGSHDAGKKRSQSQSSELRKRCENRLFHGSTSCSSLTRTPVGMRFFLWGMFRGCPPCRVRMLGQEKIASKFQ